MNEKHLEFIQGVINRHNNNSFMIKGWAITIATAIGALAGALNDPLVAIVAIGPIVMFWLLDSIFLANERCFVSLYSEIINPERKRDIPDYSMDFKQFRDERRNNWYHVLYSRTVIWFYLVLISLSFLLAVGLGNLNKRPKESNNINVNATLGNDSINVKASSSENIHKKTFNDPLVNQDTIKH